MLQLAHEWTQDLNQMSGLRDTESILPLISPLWVGVLETSGCVEDSAWVCDKLQQAVRGKKVGVRVGRLSQQEACARAALDYQSKNPGKSTGLEADNPVFKAPFLPQVVSDSFHAEE